MTITQSTAPYEILVRFDTEGAFSGAHIINQDIVRDDDEILNIKSSDAGALTKDELLEFFGNQASDLIENLSAATNRIEILEQSLLDAKSALEAELKKNASDPLTRKQMMAGLAKFDLLDAVNGFFLQLSDEQEFGSITGKDAKMIWAMEDYFHPDDGLFLMISSNPAFNLSAIQVAEMVAWARTVE